VPICPTTKLDIIQEHPSHPHHGHGEAEYNVCDLLGLEKVGKGSDSTSGVESDCGTRGAVCGESCGIL